jgi:predicted permease
MKLWNRLRHFARRRSLERELEEELQAHREMTEERLRREGMSAEQARAAAQQSFGNLTLALEDSRGAWNFAWLESLGQDIRYAVRCFRNARLFSLTVILTIGLALGLNTLLFTGFNAYVLAPFSVQDPYSLYSTWWNTKAVTGRGFSWNEFQELRKDNGAFSDLVAMRRAILRFNGQPLKGELVSGNYFSMLGVGAEIGRTLIPSDAERPGSNAVIVLSYAAWKSKFQEDPGVVGKTILLQGRPFEIVGIARHNFAGIQISPPDFWAPMTMYNQILNGPDLFGPGNPHPLEVTGRLKPKITLSQARASLLVSAKAITANYAPEDRVIGIGIESGATSVPITASTIEQMLAGGAAFILILLLACANVANMMLARAMARQREIGLRLALGAARPRLVRQLLTEGFVLAIPSAALGFGITWIGAVAGTRALYAILPSEIAGELRIAPIHLDWRVFTFVLIAACIATMGFALAPALQATRGDLIRATRGEFTSRQRTGRLRNILLTAQVAICVMLLICAGVFLRRGREVQAADVGLDVHNVIEIDTRQDLHLKVVEALASDRSVEALATVWRTPLYGELRGVMVEPEEASSFVYAGYNYVSREYFDVFRIPITRGRNFTVEESRAQAPVIVISERTAQKFWPHADAIGQMLRIRALPQAALHGEDNVPQFTTRRVIGIARDVVSGSLIMGTDPTCIYLPVNSEAPNGYSLLVRVRGNAEVARQSLDTMLSSAVPGAVTQMVPMEQPLDLQYFPFRIFAGISVALGALALALTAIGIYGVIAYLVEQRSKEIGIRMALGASTRSVVRLVLSQSIKLTVIGIVIGAAIATVVERVALSQVYMVKALESPVYAVSIGIVLAAAAIAAVLPARRASRLDPMSVLRHD